MSSRKEEGLQWKSSKRTLGVEVGLVEYHESRDLVRERDTAVSLETDRLKVLKEWKDDVSGQKVWQGRGRRLGYLDDLLVLLVRLAEDSLRSRVVEEAVVRKGRHPGADAVRSSVVIWADEHVETCAMLDVSGGKYEETTEERVGEKEAERTAIIILHRSFGHQRCKSVFLQRSAELVYGGWAREVEGRTLTQ
jgi:hypothetical protein